jgi:hypothetical protein
MSANSTFSGNAADPIVIDPVPAGKLAAPEPPLDAPADPPPAPAEDDEPAHDDPPELPPAAAVVAPPELPLLPHPVSARTSPNTAENNK